MLILKTSKHHEPTKVQDGQQSELNGHMFPCILGDHSQLLERLSGGRNPNLKTLGEILMTPQDGNKMMC